MNDPWKSLELAASETMDLIWYEFAKEGRESEVLAPLARYPNAAAWLARSMGTSADYKSRKLAAMLGGWVQSGNHLSILADMLDNERKVFRKDSASANSVGEDIMFAATRWADSKNAQVRNAGIEILERYITDAIEGVPWNDAHWAVANLYRATGGQHPIFRPLQEIEDRQIEDQRFLRNAINALRLDDQRALSRMVAMPAPSRSLSPDDPHYAAVSRLWALAELAEEAKQSSS